MLLELSVTSKCSGKWLLKADAIIFCSRVPLMGHLEVCFFTSRSKNTMSSQDIGLQEKVFGESLMLFYACWSISRRSSSTEHAHHLWCTCGMLATWEHVTNWAGGLVFNPTIYMLVSSVGVWSTEPTLSEGSRWDSASYGMIGLYAAHWKRRLRSLIPSIPLTPIFPPKLFASVQDVKVPWRPPLMVTPPPLRPGQPVPAPDRFL